MRRHVTKLLDDEHKAVKAYGAGISAARKQGDTKTAKTLSHIRGEEKHHATELKKVKRVMGGNTSLPASHPKAKALTEARRDNMAAKCEFVGD